MRNFLSRTDLMWTASFLRSFRPEPAIRKVLRSRQRPCWTEESPSQKGPVRLLRVAGCWPTRCRRRLHSTSAAVRLTSGGIPWGMGTAPFEASEEPARKVLERLIRLSEAEPVSSRHYWLVRCDSSWCSINVENVLSGICSKNGQLLRGAPHR